MSEIAWLVCAAATLPVFGLATWLRFVDVPLEAEMHALALSQHFDFSM